MSAQEEMEYTGPKSKRDVYFQCMKEAEEKGLPGGEDSSTHELCLLCAEQLWPVYEEVLKVLREKK